MSEAGSGADSESDTEDAFECGRCRHIFHSLEEFTLHKKSKVCKKRKRKDNEEQPATKLTKQDDANEKDAKERVEDGREKTDETNPTSLSDPTSITRGNSTDSQPYMEMSDEGEKSGSDIKAPAKKRPKGKKNKVGKMGKKKTTGSIIEGENNGLVTGQNNEQDQSAEKKKRGRPKKSETKLKIDQSESQLDANSEGDKFSKESGHEKAETEPSEKNDVEKGGRSLRPRRTNLKSFNLQNSSKLGSKADDESSGDEERLPSPSRVETRYQGLDMEEIRKEVWKIDSENMVKWLQILQFMNITTKHRVIHPRVYTKSLLEKDFIKSIEDGQGVFAGELTDVVSEGAVKEQESGNEEDFSSESEEEQRWTRGKKKGKIKKEPYGKWHMIETPKPLIQVLTQQMEKGAVYTYQTYSYQDTEYPCKLCLQFFDSAWMMAFHYMRDHGRPIAHFRPGWRNPNKGITIKEFDVAYILVIPKKESDTQVLLYNCIECDKKFLDVQLLRKHLEKSHLRVSFLIRSGDSLASVKTSKEHICDFCGRSFPEYDNRRSHMQYRCDKRKTIQCDHCDYRTCKPSRMETHMSKNHTRKKPMTCNYCKAFCTFDKEAYKEHLEQEHKDQIDNKEQSKTLMCKYCGEEFAEDKKHVHAKKCFGKFRCTFCKEHFSLKEELQEHIRTFHDFTCRFCDQTYHNCDRLADHLRKSHHLRQTEAMNESKDSVLSASESSLKGPITPVQHGPTTVASSNPIVAKHKCFLCYSTFDDEDQLETHNNFVHKVWVHKAVPLTTEVHFQPIQPKLVPIIQAKEPRVVENVPEIKEMSQEPEKIEVEQGIENTVVVESTHPHSQITFASTSSAVEDGHSTTTLYVQKEVEVTPGEDERSDVAAVEVVEQQPQQQQQQTVFKVPLPPASILSERSQGQILPGAHTLTQTATGQHMQLLTTPSTTQATVQQQQQQPQQQQPGQQQGGGVDNDFALFQNAVQSLLDIAGYPGPAPDRVAFQAAPAAATDPLTGAAVRPYGAQNTWQPAMPQQAPYANYQATWNQQGPHNLYQNPANPQAHYNQYQVHTPHQTPYGTYQTQWNQQVQYNAFTSQPGQVAPHTFTAPTAVLTNQQQPHLTMATQSQPNMFQIAAPPHMAQNVFGNQQRMTQPLQNAFSMQQMVIQQQVAPPGFRAVQPQVVEQSIVEQVQQDPRSVPTPPPTPPQTPQIQPNQIIAPQQQQQQANQTPPPQPQTITQIPSQMQQQMQQQPQAIIQNQNQSSPSPQADVASVAQSQPIAGQQTITISQSSQSHAPVSVISLSNAQVQVAPPTQIVESAEESMSTLPVPQPNPHANDPLAEAVNAAINTDSSQMDDDDDDEDLSALDGNSGKVEENCEEVGTPHPFMAVLVPARVLFYPNRPPIDRKEAGKSELANQALAASEEDALKKLKQIGHFCVMCEELLPSYQEFYDHMTAKHEMELRYMCQLHNCQQTFSDSKIYKKHAAVHQPRSFMYCITCEVAFPSSSELNSHNKTIEHQNKWVESMQRKYICPACKSRFKTKTAYAEHMETLHSYQCSQCMKIFRCPSHLDRHMKEKHCDEKDFDLCEICGQRFNPARMQTHKMTHWEDKPYKCEQCGKQFIRKDKLKLHEQTHLDGMNFTCPVEGCSKAFRRSDRLREHMRYHRDGPCICPHCGKALSRKDNLNQHMVIHNGNYPYWCFKCGKGFTRQKYLVKHQSQCDGCNTSPY